MFYELVQLQYYKLTELMTGKFNRDPITGILRRKLIATGKKPLKSKECLKIRYINITVTN